MLRAQSTATLEIVPASRKWYAVYTSSRHEKRVAEHLRQRSVEIFLPLYKVVHKWKNGVRADVDLPLFPGYLFARIAAQEQLRVLEVPSVVCLVGSNSQPTAVPDHDIEALRSAIMGLNAEPHPYLSLGDRVRILAGPLRGQEGILIRKKQEFRVVLSIDLIMQSIAVEVDLADLEQVPDRRVAKATC